MNHPYLYPDQCPWLQEYHDLNAILRNRPLPNDEDTSREDYDDFEDCEPELGYRRS